MLRVRHISPRACVFLRAHHEHASAGTQHVRPCTSHTRPRASVLDGAHTALHRPPGGCPHIRGPLSRHVHVSTRMAEQVTLPGLCLPSCGQAVHTGLTLRGCAYVCPHPHPCTRGCSVRAEPTAQQRRLQPGLKIHHKLSLQHPRHLADWASAPPRPAQMPEGTTPASRSATTAAPATALSPAKPLPQGTQDGPYRCSDTGVRLRTAGLAIRIGMRRYFLSAVSSSPSPPTHLLEPIPQHLPLSSPWGPPGRVPSSSAPAEVGG